MTGAREHRLHFLTVWYNSRKWCLLLLVPFLRAFVWDQQGWTLVFASAWDIILSGVLIVLSLVRWRGSRYRIHRGLQISHRFLWFHRLWVQAEDAASIEVECTPLMALFGARRVRMNTAGLRSRSDATVMMSAENSRLLLGQKRLPVSQRMCSWWAVTLMAASGSNAALGMLTLAPVLRQAAGLLGEDKNKFINEAGRLFATALPAVLQIMANLMLLGWGFAFANQWMRTHGFYAGKSGASLHIKSGLFTRRDIRIDMHKITTLELRQTLLMRLFRLYTATITAAGYGRERGTRPVLVPAARSRHMRTLLNRLLTNFPVSAVSLRPVKSGWIRYVGPPLIAFLLFFFTWAMAWEKILSLIGIIGSAWWMLVRLIGFFHSGMGVSHHAVSIRYPKGLAFYEVHIPLEVADSITITRLHLRRPGDLCTVEVRTFGEKRRRHRVYGLPYPQARRLADKMCGS